MKFCPITYEEIPADQQYSKHGLHLLAAKLTHLQPLALNATELRAEALNRVGKMSIQGVQAKLSARLDIQAGEFEIVNQLGRYILKPQSSDYLQLPENEAITMQLAACIDIEVPTHGLVYSKDNSFTYFIQRFDRGPKNKRLAVEDFAQLLGMTRETKYRSSIEQVIHTIEKYCSFPKIEFLKLFKLILFNFIVGNEDMHLKNFSLITRANVISLSPAYDLLNTSIAIGQPVEELALPLRGRKNNLRRQDFIDYLAIEKLQLSHQVIEQVLTLFNEKMPLFKQYIRISYLSYNLKQKYLALLEDRCNQIHLKA